MALSTGQVNDAFNQVLGRNPNGDELRQYTSDQSLDGSPGQQVLRQRLTPSSGIQGDLNNYNNDIFSQANSNPARVNSITEIAQGLKSSGLLPNNPAPVAPNLADTYNQLTKAKGIDAIQASINDLKSQQDAIASQLQVTKTAERGKPVAQNVIEGRISQEQQQSQDQYDFVGRQLSRKTDEMNSALASVQAIMQFTQQDYQNASQSYAQQFDQAINVINLVQGIQQHQKDDVQRAQDNARANLQIFTNAITAGNLDFHSLPSDQQANINKLEVQAGLPIGFTAALKEKVDPKANIISTSENDGQIQVLIKNPDGSIGLQTYGTKNPPKPVASKGPSAAETAASNKAQATSALKSDARAGKSLSQVFAAYSGFLDPNTIYQLYNANSKYGPDKNKNAVPGTGYLSNYGVTLYK